MNKFTRFDIHEIIPKKESVLRNMGVPKGKNVSNKADGLISMAMDIFSDESRPVGIHSEILKNEFESTFEGQGKNAKDTPLQHVIPHSNRLALFALTMGKDVCEKIGVLFNDNNFALGSILDAVASLSADKAVSTYERNFSNELLKRQNNQSDNTVISYSPGYCGWHISGQKKLFQYLHPEKIGISLNDNYLMNPLKSVTGLLVSGKDKIHIFKANYPFCRSCKDASCQGRMKRIINLRKGNERKSD